MTVSNPALHDWGILLAAVGAIVGGALGILNHFAVREVHLLVNDRLDKALVHISALEAALAGKPLEQQRAEDYLRSSPAVVAETSPPK